MKPDYYVLLGLALVILLVILWGKAIETPREKEKTYRF